MLLKSRRRLWLHGFRRHLKGISISFWQRLSLVLFVFSVLLAWVFAHFVRVVFEKDALQILLTIGVGLSGLWTFWQTKKQSQQQFEVKALNDNFIDILNRFASKDSVAIRANAAIRLAEIALQPMPGKPMEKTPENYPFFLRSASQLAAALHIEDEQAVRTEIVKAVARMTDFLKRGGESIAKNFIYEFADANRMALANFVRTLAEYCAITEKVDDDYLKVVSSIAPFHWRLYAQSLEPITCLRNLFESNECQDAIVVQKLIREANGFPPSDKISPELLNKLEQKALQLIASRDTLSNVITCASKYEGKWFEERLNLRKCFFSGALFVRLNLPYAYLSGSHLEGLRATDVNFAHTNLSYAYLQHASLANAVMCFADLIGSKLQFSYCNKADFTDADLSDAKMFRASCQDVKLTRTKMFHLQVVNSNPNNVLDLLARPLPNAFKGANWWEADYFPDKRKTGFMNVEITQEDTTLKEFFQSHEKEWGGPEKKTK